MTTNSPSASERRDDVSDRSEQQTLARTVGANLATLDWAWIAVAVAGGALIVRGLRTARGRSGRRLLQIVAGGVLLAFGYSRLGSAGGRGEDRADEASADAHVELERPDSDVNPKDVTEEPEAAPSSGDEGDVQFTDDQTDDLDGAQDAGGDPAESDDGVAVDISEAAVADESGEAAGPTAAQAEPTTTKTDLSPPTNAEEPDVEEGLESGPGDGEGEAGDGEGAVDGAGDAEAGDGETVETAGGAEVHTDTVESGTSGIDDEDVTDESGEPMDDPGVEELADDEAADYQAPGGDEGSDETVETAGGAEVHTDTVESGTMDIDEEDVEGDADGDEAGEDED